LRNSHLLPESTLIQVIPLQEILLNIAYSLFVAISLGWQAVSTLYSPLFTSLWADFSFTL
jgi:hypothetical protein